jgi:hypothetical protein
MGKRDEKSIVRDISGKTGEEQQLHIASQSRIIGAGRSRGEGKEALARASNRGQLELNVSILHLMHLASCTSHK